MAENRQPNQAGEGLRGAQEKPADAGELLQIWRANQEKADKELRVRQATSRLLIFNYQENSMVETEAMAEELSKYEQFMREGAAKLELLSGEDAPMRRALEEELRAIDQKLEVTSKDLRACVDLRRRVVAISAGQAPQAEAARTKAAEQRSAGCEATARGACSGAGEPGDLPIPLTQLEAAQEEWGKVSTCLPDGTPCSSSDDELVCELKGGDLNKAPTPWPTPISTATDASIERLCARMLQGRSKTLEAYKELELQEEKKALERRVQDLEERLEATLQREQAAEQTLQEERRAAVALREAGDAQLAASRVKLQKRQEALWGARYLLALQRHDAEAIKTLLEQATAAHTERERELLDKLRGTQAQATAADRRAAEVQQQLDAACKAKLEADAQAAAQQGLLAAAERALAATKEAASEAQLRAETAQQRADGMTGQLHAAVRRAEEAEAQEAAKQQQLQQELQAAIERAEDAEKEAANLRGMADQANLRAAASAQLAKAVAQASNNIQGELEFHAAHAASLEKELNTSIAANNLMCDDVDALKQEVADLEDERDAAWAEADNLADQLAAAEQAAAARQTEAAEAQQRADAAQQRADEPDGLSGCAVRAARVPAAPGS